jgi:hypothetical protein
MADGNGERVPAATEGGVDGHDVVGITAGREYPATGPSAVTDRWFSSGLSFDSNLDSAAYVAVSRSGDPTGSWLIYTLISNTSGILYDQPKLALTADKAVVSWTTIGSGGTAFLGQDIWILEKADMLSGNPLRDSAVS